MDNTCFTEFMDIVKKNAEEYSKLARCVSEIIRTENEKWAVICRSISKILENTPDNIKNAQNRLFSRGWYMFEELSVFDIEEISIMTEKKLEELMISYGRDLKLKICERIEKHFPDRLEIIKEAMIVHDKGLFNFSIPVMLAQADGISQEMFGVAVFSKENKVPKTHKARLGKIKCLENSATELFLRPLDIVTSININTEDRDEKKEKDKNYCTFNRHGVMHGLDLDYGTEANSLRCVVLLSYLMDLKEKL